MKGLHVEVRSKFNRSVEKYIHVSRVLQGQDDFRYATAEEKNDIIMRFDSLKDSLKGFQMLKFKEQQAAAAPSGDRAAGGLEDFEDLGDEPPKTGFWQTRHLPLEERKRLHALKDAWKRRKRGEPGATSLNPSSSNPPQTSTMSPSMPTSAVPTSMGAGPGAGLDNDEMDRAIRESVAQTSRGDRAEDARIEEQMRASVREMRRIAEENRRFELERGMRDFKERPAESSGLLDRKGPLPEDITEEEFEALIEEAVRQSMAGQGEGGSIGLEDHGLVGAGNDHADEDEQLRQALEASKRTTTGADDDDDDLKKALEDSERAHREHLARRSTERSEEDIILEYVKKQSLAEEEFRRQKAKGKAATAPGDNTEDDDEALRTALEESLKMNGKEGGPSGS